MDRDCEFQLEDKTVKHTKDNIWEAKTPTQQGEKEKTKQIEQCVREGEIEKARVEMRKSEGNKLRSSWDIDERQGTWVWWCMRATWKTQNKCTTSSRTLHVSVVVLVCGLDVSKAVCEGRLVKELIHGFAIYNLSFQCFIMFTIETQLFNQYQEQLSASWKPSFPAIKCCIWPSIRRHPKVHPEVLMWGHSAFHGLPKTQMEGVLPELLWWVLF